MDACLGGPVIFDIYIMTNNIAPHTAIRPLLHRSVYLVRELTKSPHTLHVFYVFKRDPNIVAVGDLAENVIIQTDMKTQM